MSRKSISLRNPWDFELLPSWQSFDASRAKVRPGSGFYDELPADPRKQHEQEVVFSYRMQQLAQEDTPAASGLVDTLMASADPIDRMAAAKALSMYQVGRMSVDPDEVRADTGRWQQLLNDPETKGQARFYAYGIVNRDCEGVFQPLHDILHEQETGTTGTF